MAGKEQIRNNLSDIIRVLCNAGYEITIFATQGAGDATRIVEEHGMDYSFVVCSGGDGTMNEVATGLMKLEKCPVCGYIPAGTVNDFASSLNMPKVMKDAAELIVNGSIFDCDMGSLMTGTLHMLQVLAHLRKFLTRHHKNGKMPLAK